MMMILKLFPTVVSACKRTFRFLALDLWFAIKDIQNKADNTDVPVLAFHD